MSIEPGTVEYGVRCPDGYLWPDVPQDSATISLWIINTDCACGSTDHEVVAREANDWTVVPTSELP